MIVYLNGEYVPANEARIPVWDGGFLYGDGIYTTLRTYRGRPVDLAAHHRRLMLHAGELDLPVPCSLTDLQTAAERLARENGLEDTDGRMRITISRGGSADRPLPLSNLQTIASTVLVTLSAVAAELDRWQTEGIPVVTLGASYARGNFPALKTLNSLAALRALRRAAVSGCPEAILTDLNGALLEGAVSNLFLVAADHLLTPVSNDGFLAGRTRERILAIATAEGIEVREKALDRRHLEAACEVFMASSVREVLPVIRIDGHSVAGGLPGPVTRIIQDRYRFAMLADSGLG